MTEPESLYQFVYCSRARVAPSAEHFNAMCDTFAQRNAEHDISGVFLAIGDRFVQVIEGTPSHISQLAANIRRDVRHIEFQPLIERVITVRAFAEWTMAGLHLGQEVELAPHEHDRLRRVIRSALGRPNDRDFWCSTIAQLPKLLRPRQQVQRQRAPVLSGKSALPHPTGANAKAG